MATNSYFRRTVRASDDGFSIIEAIVAVTLLAIALVITIPGIMNSMRTNQRSKELTVSENLAQARLEEIRSLNYNDVGNAGFAPDGVLQVDTQETIEGVTYDITTKVSYVGSLTGLNIVAGGGDGVEGAFDPGVDYKYVEVTVVSPDRAHDPVKMETIVSPPSIGAHENIANARVTILRHEPYGPYPEDYPETQVTPTVGPIQRSGVETPVQIFPALDPGDYTVGIVQPSPWLIHPDDATPGGTAIELVEGQLTESVIRIYQPVELTVTAYDDATLVDIPSSDITVTLLEISTGTSTPYPKGQTVIPDLVPGQYDVTVAATNYYANTVSGVEVTGSSTLLDWTEDVPLTFNPNPMVTIQFWANTWISSGQYTGIRGAFVRIEHAGLGIDETIETDIDGNVFYQIPENTSNIKVTGTSPFGHTTDIDWFSVGTGSHFQDLNLGRGSNRRWVVKNVGDTSQVRYKRLDNPGAWHNPSPKPNSSGIVTMVVVPGRWRIRAECFPGAWKSQADLWTSGSQTTKTWWAPGSC